MPGKTPLVGWIKGYMVPELMGIEVNKILIRRMDFEEHLQRGCVS